MLCGMYKNSEQLKVILIFYQDGKRKFRRQEFRSAQQAIVSTGTVTNVTSACGSMEKTSVDRVTNCG